LQGFIGENPGSRLVRFTEVEYPRFELRFGGKNKTRKPEIIEVEKFIGVKSFKARGKRLTTYEVSLINELEPVIPVTEPVLSTDEPEIKQNEDKKSLQTDGQMSLDL